MLSATKFLLLSATISSSTALPSRAKARPLLSVSFRWIERAQVARPVNFISASIPCRPTLAYSNSTAQPLLKARPSRPTPPCWFRWSASSPYSTTARTPPSNRALRSPPTWTPLPSFPQVGIRALCLGTPSPRVSLTAAWSYTFRWSSIFASSSATCRRSILPWPSKGSWGHTVRLFPEAQQAHWPWGNQLLAIWDQPPAEEGGIGTLINERS